MIPPTADDVVITLEHTGRWTLHRRDDTWEPDDSETRCEHGGVRFTLARTAYDLSLLEFSPRELCRWCWSPDERRQATHDELVSIALGLTEPYQPSQVPDPDPRPHPLTDALADLPVEPGREDPS